MKYKKKELVEFIGATAVVLSLLFLGYELRMNRQVAMNDSLGSAMDSTTTMLSTISENASTWRRGCINEELSADEEMIFSALVVSVDRFFFFRFQRADKGITGVDPAAWPRQTAIHRLLFPGFDKKWLEIYGVRSGNPYFEAVHSNYAALKNEWGPGMQDASLCGVSSF